MLHGENGYMEPVPDEDLPVLLPDDVKFMPTGQSPLLFHDGFLNVKANGHMMKRETDTMDTFMCSSWYHLRYLSPQYEDAPFDPEEAAYWLPVDVYTGGAEHATMHLLYTRFFNKALRDTGVFDDTIEAMQSHGRDPDSLLDEPMTVLRNQGQVLGEERPGHFILAYGRWDGNKLFADRIEVIDGPDNIPPDFDGVIGEIMRRTENVLQVGLAGGGLTTVEVLPGAHINDPHIPGENNINQLLHHMEIQRMSKSKGNVVNPDLLVKQYGGDTVRAYMMSGFNWEKGGPWDSKGIQGVVRWVNDVWEIVTAGPPAGNPDEDAQRDILRKAHQTIQRFEDSMERFSFNTAVAALMEFRNALQKTCREASIDAETWNEAVSIVLRLMAPITPFVAEELWARMGGDYSVHQQAFPEYDADIAAEDEITLVVQVNGKVRDRIQAPASISEEDAIAQALASEKVQKHLDGEPRKVIYIAKTGLVNIVS
jgi:leucyl-tRNA synthetase